MSDHYEELLDQVEALRDRFRGQLALRDAGKVIFVAPVGFTLDEWVETLKNEVSRLTDILVQAGRN
ncbi:MAG: hypothetical protein V7704_08700 [Aurantimonas endophytica]